MYLKQGKPILGVNVCGVLISASERERERTDDNSENNNDNTNNGGRGNDRACLTEKKKIEFIVEKKIENSEKEDVTEKKIDFVNFMKKLIVREGDRA